MILLAVISLSFSCVCSGLLEMAVWAFCLSFPTCLSGLTLPPTMLGPRGSLRLVLCDSSAFSSHPLPFSSAVGPLAKPALISWLEAREPWGLNVQRAQPKAKPVAAQAGEFPRTYQILLLQHLFSFLRPFTPGQSWGIHSIVC